MKNTALGNDRTRRLRLLVDSRKKLCGNCDFASDISDFSVLCRSKKKSILFLNGRCPMRKWVKTEPLIETQSVVSSAVSCRKVQGLIFPGHGFSIKTLPKNGGTSLWSVANKIRFGKNAEGNVYDKANSLIGRMDKFPYRIIVVRDPIDRFVSGYCYLRRKGSMASEWDMDFNKFVEKFPLYYQNGDVRHHLMPQFYASGCMPLNYFTDVIPFSKFDDVFDLIDCIVGYHVERPRFQSTDESKPVVKTWHKEFLRDFYAIDYHNGYCDHFTES